MCSSDLSAHFREYQRLGDAAIKVLGDFTPLVERVSIDEAFADVAGCTHLFGSPADIAQAIRRRVRAELGPPVPDGAAPPHPPPKIPPPGPTRGSQAPHLGAWGERGGGAVLSAGVLGLSSISIVWLSRNVSDMGTRSTECTPEYRQLAARS